MFVKSQLSRRDVNETPTDISHIVSHLSHFIGKHDLIAVHFCRARHWTLYYSGSRLQWSPHLFWNFFARITGISQTIFTRLDGVSLFFRRGKCKTGDVLMNTFYYFV